MGDPELRSLLVLSATSVLRHMRRQRNTPKWLKMVFEAAALQSRAVAFVNKDGPDHLVLLT
ncbi:hypothetical protein X769_22080 [Mesorhizobium sp. LSJC268A00]|nr:hypothetical protein X769_22080 [Mesorhizobium sp. LSJC268A00]